MEQGVKALLRNGYFMIKNLSIRYKLLFGFFLIVILFVGFVSYFLIKINSLNVSLSNLDAQAKKLQLFLRLDSDNKQLSDAVKSYMLTGNAKWEHIYDTTSSDLSGVLQTLKTISQPDEVTDLTRFETLITKLQGTELLILAKTKEGDKQKALTLFDSNYEKQQAESATVITKLVNNENTDFFTTLQADDATLIAIRNLLFGTVGFILLTIIAIAIGISSLIEKSLKALVQNVNKIAGGDLHAKVPITSHDEIGNLANAFNTMAEKLQGSYTGLEQKIQEKTKELLDKVTDLEGAKRGMLNLMEDLQSAKTTAEKDKVTDEAILSSVGEGMVFSDEAGKIVFMNKAAEDILGCVEQDVIGKAVFETFSLQDEQGNLLQKNMRPIAETMQSKTRVTQTVNFLRKDNQKFLLSLTTTPVMKEDTVFGVIEIFRDITKEKEIDRMKTEFISLASHQLRTPLSAIKWFSEMLVGGDAGELTAEQKDMAQSISESTQRMIELVNSLLNISRMESGRIMVDPKPTDLKELVDGLVKELQVKITQKQQTLVVSVHQDLPEINLDPKLIRQVYMNLLTNAIKYTPKDGEISVFISKKDDQVISQVTDNGYGIPKQQQDKIFQKFFRAENVAKIETDGTGLGLYLIKAIIESSHGKIWFESDEGKGTSFWFSLPITGMEAKKGEVSLDN